MISLLRVVPGLVSEWPATRDRWANLKTVGLIDTFNRANVNEEPQLAETRASSAASTSRAASMMDVMRSHWSVETIREIFYDKTSFDEYRCKIWKGNAPENLSLIRRLAIAIMGPYCRHWNVGCGEVRSRCAENFTFLEALLTVRAPMVGSLTSGVG